MRLISAFILLFLSFSFVQAQELEGVVQASEDSLPIEGTHIVNISADKMAVSDENGSFFLVAEVGDTLVVSNVNFNTKKLIVNNEEFLKIRLNPASIQLDEVRVSNLPENEAAFRKKMIDMGDVGDETFVISGMPETKPKGKIPKKYDPEYTNSVGYAISKPISFIVKKLSKSHKNKLKYYQTVANKESVISNNKKYNPEIIEELTGSKGDKLTDFIKYLDLDPAFVKGASEYEIAVRILREYDYYTSQEG